MIVLLMRSAYNYRYSCEVKEVEMKKNIGGIIAGLCAIAVTEFEIIKYINLSSRNFFSLHFMLA